MPETVANIVFEFRSPAENWARMLKRAAMFLSAGFDAVCILDYTVKKMAIFYPDRVPATLSIDDELRLPGDFEGKPRIKIRRFFE
jgi:hypothetical protein